MSTPLSRSGTNRHGLVLFLVMVGLLCLLVLAGRRLPTIPAYAGAMAVMSCIVVFKSSVHRREGRTGLSVGGKVVAALFLAAAVATLLAQGEREGMEVLRVVSVGIAWLGIVVLATFEMYDHLRRR